MKEIEKLHAKSLDLAETVLKPGDNPLAGVSGDLFDIQVAFEAGRGARLSVRVHGQAITCAGGTLSCLGRSAAVSPVEGKVALRILVDRTSLEVFANNGAVSMSFCFLPKESDAKPQLHAEGGDIDDGELTLAQQADVDLQSLDQAAELQALHAGQAGNRG